MENLIQKILEGGGINLTWLGMGTVFFCLSLLFLFFATYGLVAKRCGEKEALAQEDKKSEGEEGVEGLEIESGDVPGQVSAVIAMALQETMSRTRAGLSPVSVFESGVGSSWRIAGRAAQHARSKFWER